MKSINKKISVFLMLLALSSSGTIYAAEFQRPAGGTCPAGTEERSRNVGRVLTFYCEYTPSPTCNSSTHILSGGVIALPDGGSTGGQCLLKGSEELKKAIESDSNVQDPTTPGGSICPTGFGYIDKTKKCYRFGSQQYKEAANDARISPKAERLSVSGYKTQISIPCQPLLGGQCPSPATPAGYIARIYQFGLMIVGFAAFTMIIYGGVLYVFAAGDITKTSDAKDVIQNAIYGLVLFLGAYLILYTINPRLVDLRNPELEFLRVEKLIAKSQSDGVSEIGSASGEKSDLCKLTMNGKIGVSINTVNSGTYKDITGSTCISCVDNAIKDSSGKCACKFEFAQLDGTCTSYAACKSAGGTISEGDWSKGQSATCNISGGTSASSKDKPCTDFGGTCRMTDNPNAPGFYKGMCLSNPSPNYLCYKP